MHISSHYCRFLTISAAVVLTSAVYAQDKNTAHRPHGHSNRPLSENSAPVPTVDLVANKKGKVKLQRQSRNVVASPSVFTPGTPTARLVARQPGAADPIGKLVSPGGVVESSTCEVDFSDYDAFDRLTFAETGYSIYAEDTFTWSPWWFQACNPLDHAVVRPIGDTHFHLNYEDPNISACNGLNDWGIVQEDGTCEDFDPREKPRSILPHDNHGALHLYLYDGNNKKPFGLNRIRVMSQTPVRLCYKPVQEDDGEWETSEPSGTTSPGIWLCWDALSTGYWDLSTYAQYITEVKISSTNFAGFAHLDDIELKLY